MLALSTADVAVVDGRVIVARLWASVRSVVHASAIAMVQTRTVKAKPTPKDKSGSCALQITHVASGERTDGSSSDN